MPLHAQPLALEEVRWRIVAHHVPYRRELARLQQAILESQGFVCHINAHSMKSVGNAMNDDNGQGRPDVVLGDRGGTSADPRLALLLADSLSRQGLQVRINHPYPGGDIGIRAWSWRCAARWRNCPRNWRATSAGLFGPLPRTAAGPSRCPCTSPSRP